MTREEEVVEDPEEPRYTGGGSSSYRSGGSSRSTWFSTSTSATTYQRHTRQFLRAATRIPKRRLKAELEELKQSMAQQQNSQPTYADQVALLRSHTSLQRSTCPAYVAVPPEGVAEEVETTTRSGSEGSTRRSCTDSCRSALAQPVSDSVMIARMAIIRRRLSHCRRRSIKQTARNTIKACAWRPDHHERSERALQTLGDACRGSMYCHETPSSRVKAASKAKDSTSRFFRWSITEQSFPCELQYDNDGQAESTRRQGAAKEMAANLGTEPRNEHIHHQPVCRRSTAIRSRSWCHTGRVAVHLQKMREEKVHLKSGYTLMLYQNNQ